MFSKKISHLGFTLAEILITLVIIGVIAALTIPTLMNSTGDKEYVAASKRVLATVAEAGRQMAVEDDIKRYKNVVDFVENGLSKRVDINKYCAPTGMGSKETTGVPTDCGFAKNYSIPDGTLNSAIDFSTNIQLNENFGLVWGWNGSEKLGFSSTDNIDNYSFQMSNGYSVMLFYNPHCISAPDGWKTRKWYGDYPPQAVCMSGVYDMNGKKGPNQAGRDLGFFHVEGSGATSIASVALPLTEYGVFKNGAKSGSLSTYEEAMKFCESKGAILPSVEEGTSMSMAYSLIEPSRTSTEWFWSGSTGYDSTEAWVYTIGIGSFGSGDRWQTSVTNTNKVQCVRK